MICRRIVMFAFIMLMLFPCISQALSVGTHQQINQNIAGNAMQGFYLDPYLKNNLAFPSGINEQVKGQTVQRWIGEGGIKEDKPAWITCAPYLSRSVNHFHNPLNDNGFSGFIVDGFLSGDSALRWAQYPMGTQSLSFMTYLCGDYSWFDVRDYFFRALTSQTNSERDDYFEKTFRGVGQLMHLVQDMSVPEHTRNQAHVFSYAYEEWVDENLTTSIYYSAINNPFFPNDSLLRTTSPFANASIPIANLFDTNQFDGTNPDVTIYDNIGLSEYSNANFVSKDTIFISSFPYPSYSNMISYKDPLTGKAYISKIGAGDNIVHFAASKEYYPKLPLDYKELDLRLDKKVYADYAEKLLPRAIGYSAALMKYFFRGTLEISRPDEYVYSIIDGNYFFNGNYVPQQFTFIKAKIKNSTLDENLSGGIFQAVAKYRRRTDYQPDLSADPPIDNSTYSSRESVYSYSMSAPLTLVGDLVSTTTDNNVYLPVIFDFSASPIPAGITDLRLLVIYKGTIGREDNVAVAVGMKDLMEPIHHLYFNLSDRYMIDNVLYTADEIRSNPYLASRVNLNEIDPHDVLFEAGFMDNGSLQNLTRKVVNTTVPAGAHIRAIMLVDKDNYNYLKIKNTSPGGGQATYSFPFDGVKNQGSGQYWVFEPLYSSRGIVGNFLHGVLRCIPQPENGFCFGDPAAFPPPPAEYLMPYPATVIFPSEDIF